MLGLHVSLWTPEWDAPFTDYIVRAAELGFDAVEIPIMNPESFPFEAVSRVLAQTGLQVFCGTGLGPSTDISSLDPAVRSAGRDHLTACLDIARALGAPSLQGVIHSAWGLKKQVTEEHRSCSAEILRQIARRAGEYQMTIAVECINRYESSFLNTAAQGLDLIERIGEPNVGLHLDTFHMNIEESSIGSAISRAGRRLYHLHLSENQRGFPGSGSIDWQAVVSAAEAAGYSGPWIIESYIFPDFATSPDVSIWRAIEENPLLNLRRSLDMLRTLIH